MGWRNKWDYGKHPVSSLSSMQQVARDLVKGKSLRDALYSLAFESNLIDNIEEIETQAKQGIEKYKLC
jgi:hypothetical protein